MTDTQIKRADHLIRENDKMLTLEELKKYGADVDSGLARCMDNEALYFRLIKMAVSDNSVAALGAALKEGDLDKAFEEAHKIKGVAANLSLDPILEPVSALTELLRKKAPGDYDALYKRILEKTEALSALFE